MKPFRFDNIEDAASYLRVLSKPINEPVPLQKKHLIFVPKPKEKVVGGDILRKPIDKTAALVVSPAPWWAKPPDLQPVTQVEKVEPKPRHRKPKSRKHMNKQVEIAHAQHGNYNPTIRTAIMDGDVALNLNDVVVKVIEEINKHPAKLTALARAAFDAQGVIHESLQNLNNATETFNARIKVGLEDLRQTRFAYVTETSQMIGPLKELRQFFMGNSYDQEIARLREFVELCERIAKLKESGVLDAVSDTIIKLAN